jgi:threonine/homoserine/homoserine lactone efflux protein
MIGRIIGILVSVALIIMGLSGEYVLKGTESSTALVVVGFLFLLWEVFGLVRDKKKEDNNQNNTDAPAE